MVVIPLLEDYPVIRHLNPDFVYRGRNLILATRLIAAVRRSAIRRIGSLSNEGDRITRAVDVLMAGI